MLDSGALASGETWAALAFGVNLADAPENIDQPTTSLRDDAAARCADARAARRFSRRCARNWKRGPRVCDAKGSSRCAQAWLQRAHGLGQEARVVQGEQTLEGRIAGLSPRGELELDTAAGRRLIAAGDVFLPNAA